MKNHLKIAGVAGLAVLLIIVAILLSGDEEKTPETRVVTESQPGPKVVALQPERVVEVVDNVVPDSVIIESEPEDFTPPLPNSDALPPDDLEPIHLLNDMNPEDQPRAFDRMSFANLEQFPDGFVITGDAYLSKEGWVLDVPETNEDNIPMSALIESPTYKLQFPSNAISTGWKEVSPTGTEVLIELAASPDGENWTSWYPTTGAHMDGEIVEINEITGEYNPNYGFILGDMVFFGLGKYQYYKYSMMLYSETNVSPVVSDFFAYQQDSTMGDGHLVEYSAENDIVNSEGS